MTFIIFQNDSFNSVELDYCGYRNISLVNSLHKMNDLNIIYFLYLWGTVQWYSAWWYHVRCYNSVTVHWGSSSNPGSDRCAAMLLQMCSNTDVLYILLTVVMLWYTAKCPLILQIRKSDRSHKHHSAEQLKPFQQSLYITLTDFKQTNLFLN